MCPRKNNEQVLLPDVPDIEMAEVPRHTIAQYIKMALTEDKFGHRFNREIVHRTNLHNSTHLYWMEEHLQRSLNLAKSKVWKEANNEILGKVNVEINWRRKIIDAEILEEDEQEARRQKRIEAEIIKKNEEERVLRSIIAAAREKARLHVEDLEKKREALERRRVLEVAAAAENARIKQLAITAVGFVVAIVLPSALIKQLEYVLLAVGCVVIITSLVVYRILLTTRVAPYVKSAGLMDAEMDALSQEFVAQAMLRVREEEERYNERMRTEAADRRDRRRARRRERRRNDEADDEVDNEVGKVATVSRSEAIGMALKRVEGAGRVRRRSLLLVEAARRGSVTRTDLEEYDGGSLLKEEAADTSRRSDLDKALNRSHSLAHQMFLRKDHYIAENDIAGSAEFGDKEGG